MIVKKWITPIVIVLVILLGYFYPAKKASEFSIKNIQSSFPSVPEWSTLPNQEQLEEIQQIFSQEFRYLASGAQCYCFCSEDNKYVLKFFKMKHLTPKPWLKYLTFPWLKDYRFKKYEKRILRRQNIFKNFKLAYEECSEETGLVFLHLTKNKEIRNKVTLVDRHQKKFLLDLNQFEFFLQKKALLIGDYLDQLMQNGQKEEAVQALHALLLHVITQSRKGFIDQDSGIFHNYGFLGNQVIHFDIGQLQFDDSNKELSNIQSEVMRVKKKLKKWIKVHHPSLLPNLEEVMNALINLSYP